MPDEPTSPSGSRWEPRPNETPADETPADETPTTEAPATPATDTDRRRAQLRSRAVLAGAATALVLGGGLTGFVIGHGTAGDGSGFTPADFSRQGPGDGRLPDGQVPPDFDRDGDGGSGGGDGSGPSTSGNPT